MAVIAALWWLYFDRLAAAVEQRIHGVRSHHRLALARDAYTYLHLPLVAGIIGFALGLKHLLTHPVAGGLTLPLLYGGVAVYLATLVAIEARALHRLNTPLLAAAALACVAVPVLGRTRIVTALALLAAGCAVLVAFVAVTTAAERRRVRDLAAAEQHAAEAETSHWRRQHL